MNEKPERKRLRKKRPIKKNAYKEKAKGIGKQPGTVDAAEQERSRKMGNTAKAFWTDETGMGTVEIILIIVVLIGLVIIFKKQLNDLVKKVFQKINSDSNSIISSAFSGKC